MVQKILFTILTGILLTVPALAWEGGVDTIETSQGNLQISFIGHGTLMFAFDGKIIHVDPWSKLADYAELP